MRWLPVCRKKFLLMCHHLRLQQLGHPVPFCWTGKMFDFLGHCFSCSERLLVVLCIVCYPAADLQVAESFDYWVVVSSIFYFHPYLGKWSNLTNIFQRDWNHQPDYYILLHIFDIIYWLLYIWASIARYPPPPPTPWLWVCIVAPQYPPPPCGVGGVGGGGWWCTPLPPVVWVVWVVWVVVGGGGGGRSCICMYMNVSVPPSPLWCGWCRWWWVVVVVVVVEEVVYVCIWMYMYGMNVYF